MLIYCSVRRQISFVNLLQCQKTDSFVTCIAVSKVLFTLCVWKKRFFRKRRKYIVLIFFFRSIKSKKKSTSKKLSPKKALDSKAGSGLNYKSKEYISSDSSSDSDEPLKKKLKKEKSKGEKKDKPKGEKKKKKKEETEEKSSSVGEVNIIISLVVLER